MTFGLWRARRATTCMLALAAAASQAAAQQAARPNGPEAPLQVRSATTVPKTFIAPLDGRADDGPAFSAARADAAPGGTIVVGPGTFHPLSPVVGGPKEPVLWSLQGLSYAPGGVAPVVGIDHDLVENVLPGGTRFLGRGIDTQPEAPPIFRVDRHYSFDGGRPGNVSPAVNFNCNLRGRVENYVWCNQTVVQSRAWGAGNHLAVSGSIFRPADALADGKGPRAETWAGYFENNDQTGKASDVAGSQVGIENDIYNNGPDARGFRILLQMNVGKSDPSGAPGAAGHGVLIGANDNQSTIGTGFEIKAPFTVAAFDAAGGLSRRDAPAFRMAEGQRFCLDAANAHCLTYASGRIVLSAAGRDLLELDDRGGLRLAMYATDPPTARSKEGALYLNTTRHALRMFDGTRWAFVSPQRGTPSSSHMACSPGERMYDASYEYQCVERDSWRRVRHEAF